MVIISDGHVMTGRSVSLTMILNVQATTPLVVHLTVLVPIGKNEPESGVVETTPQLPLSVGAGNVTNAPGWSGAVEAKTVAGQLSVHGCDAQSGAAVVGVFTDIDINT